MVGGVSASTQNQALSALLFLYVEVLRLRVPELQGIVRARKPQRLPVVLTRDEVRRALGELRGSVRLAARSCMAPGFGSWNASSSG